MKTRNASTHSCKSSECETKMFLLVLTRVCTCNATPAVILLELLSISRTLSHHSLIGTASHAFNSIVFHDRAFNMKIGDRFLTPHLPIHDPNAVLSAVRPPTTRFPVCAIHRNRWAIKAYIYRVSNILHALKH